RRGELPPPSARFRSIKTLAPEELRNSFSSPARAEAVIWRNDQPRIQPHIAGRHGSPHAETGGVSGGKNQLTVPSQLWRALAAALPPPLAARPPGLKNRRSYCSTPRHKLKSLSAVVRGGFRRVVY